MGEVAVGEVVVGEVVVGEVVLRRGLTAGSGKFLLPCHGRSWNLKCQKV